MYTIVASTNRKEALSLQVAEYYAAELKSHDIEANIVSLKDLPHDFVFSALYDNTGKNEAFNKVRDVVSSSEKIVFVIPEYNGSFPGILKAFVDGLSYPNGIADKKAALVGISAGNMGSSLAMSHFTDILNYLGCNVLAQKPRLTAIEDHMIEGSLADSPYAKVLQEQINKLLAF